MKPYKYKNLDDFGLILNSEGTCAVLRISMPTLRKLIASKK